MIEDVIVSGVDQVAQYISSCKLIQHEFVALQWVIKDDRPVLTARMDDVFLTRARIEKNCVELYTRSGELRSKEVPIYRPSRPGKQDLCVPILCLRPLKEGEEVVRMTGTIKRDTCEEGKRVIYVQADPGGTLIQNQLYKLTILAA
jgi:hypothetical protein